MVTHDLVRRGLAFDDAYAVAHAVRAALADRSEVTTSELRDIINAELEVLVPGQVDSEPTEPQPPTLAVTYGGERQPFSRGLLARSLYGAGIDLDHAYSLVLQIQRQLVSERVESIDAHALSERMAEILEEEIGEREARRYRLIRRLQRLPQPLVIYCAGATGTGKSTLSLELAPLLHTFRITSTDTIREVMRMVFSPSILPALHRSSFESAEATEKLAGEEDDAHLLRSYEEQAIRVCVGVRAVVERALAENQNILVEGVHLLPSVVPFGDLEGAAYQEMILLTTLDEETHRSHFLARGLSSARQPERYLEYFPAIRLQQERLIELAEERDIPLLDTAERDPFAPRALQMLSTSLESKLPWLAEAEQVEPRAVPGVLLILDGAPDHPLRALGARTPLQVAETPNLDRLAKEGISGLADPVAAGVVPDTASGNLSIFSQSPHAMKRGPIEAIGASLRPSQEDPRVLVAGGTTAQGAVIVPRVDDICLRANLATLDDEGRVVDRRAGRIRDGVAELVAALNEIEIDARGFKGVQLRVIAATEHRIALVLRGRRLSPSIHGSDPGQAAPPGPPLVPAAVEEGDREAERTARFLQLFEQRAREVLAAHPLNEKRKKEGLLPANVILSRGAGRVHRLQPIEHHGRELSLACVGGDRTVLGIASFLGAEVVQADGMTANLDTDLDAKFDRAFRLAKKHDLVVVHFKGADIAAHDRRADLKIEYLERFDAALGRFLEKTSKRKKHRVRVAVASDHTTVSETGQHDADPVPVVVWGPGVESDEVEAFDEASAGEGALERIPLQLLISRLFA